MSEEIVVHCTTEEEWDAVQKKAVSEGIMWCDGDTHSDSWKVYGDKSCINIWDAEGMCYADKGHYEDEGYTIISAQEYLKEGGKVGFKVGDRVIYCEAHVDEDVEGYPGNLIEADGLVLNGTYTISDVSEMGNLEFEESSYMYWHHPSHFRLLSQTTNQTKEHIMKSNSVNKAVQEVYGGKGYTGDQMLLVDKHFGDEVQDNFTGKLILKQNEEAYLKEAVAREDDEKEAAEKESE